MRWRGILASVCFFSIGFVALVESAILAEGLLTMYRFIDEETLAFDYSISVFFFGIWSALALIAGLLLSRSQQSLRFHVEKKRFLILTLIFVPSVLLFTKLFNLLF